MRIWGSLAILLAAAPSLEARTLLVAPDGSGDVTSIDAAMNLAAPGDTVAVRWGTYPTTDVELAEGVKLLGGWDAAFTTRTPGTSIAQTSGQHVFTATQGQSAATVVDGFQMTGATDSAFLCDGAMPTITNNELWGNDATDGGAIRCINGASPLIESNHIHHNSAKYGAGIRSHLGPDTSPIIRSNLIESNTAWAIGGGIAISSGSPLVEHNVIQDNWGDTCGGLLVWVFAAGERADIRWNLIIYNAARDAGGGINISSASPNIYQNTIWGNWANRGGAIFVGGGSDPTLSHNILGGSAPGEGIHCYGSFPTNDCNCIFGNLDGPYGLCPPPGTDLLVDPNFCGPGSGNFQLASNSPCLPQNNACGVQIGALGEGCGPVSVVQESWGRIKGKYR